MLSLRARADEAGWRWVHLLAVSLALLSVGLAAWGIRLRQSHRHLHARYEELRRPRPGPATAGARPELEQEAAHLRAELAALSLPQTNVAIVSLSPAEGTGAGPSAQVEPGSAVLLVLKASSHPSHSGYRLRIRSEAGALVWEGRDLRRSVEGTFTLVVPPAMLAPGEYRLELLGDRYGAVVPLDSFRLLIGPRPH